MNGRVRRCLAKTGVEQRGVSDEEFDPEDVEADECRD